MAEKKAAATAPDVTTYEQQRDAHRKVARRLKQELADIDQEIRKCEIAMGTQLDQEGEEVRKLRARREELVKRREALPGMLVGARSAALRAETLRHQILSDQAQVPYDAAQAEFEKESAEVTRLEAETELARARLKETTIRRNALQRQWELAYQEIATPSIDASRIEQGIELIKPDPFGDGW
jgi:chromosome segregation ATPase